MRSFIAIAVCAAFAGTAVAQDTLRTWRYANSVCGVRRQGRDVRRFVATDTGNGLEYDFAPTTERWHLEGCDRDPNAPAPSLQELLADIQETQKHDCRKEAAQWAKLSPARRREIAEINVRHGGSDDPCGLTP